MPERRGGSRTSRSGRTGGARGDGGSRGNGGRGNAGGDGPRAAPRLRPFWSGVITFGLVSVPVELYAANRSAGVSFRMVAPDGTPVKRQYFCPAHEREVSMDEIVRGYELDDGKFVTVRDEELERLEPEKSREIDLRRFVPVSDLDPAFYQRAYFLAPGGDTTKAYRLLAETMERTGRAGIATFVMRGREYLVAIISEDGILRAETMRFHEELRSPEDVGLPGPSRVDRKLASRFERAIQKRLEEGLDPSEMEDRHAERIEALVERKVKAGKDVAERPAEEAEREEGDAQVIDILAALREKMRAASAGDSDGSGGARSGGTAGGRRGGRPRGERPRRERRRGREPEREAAAASTARTKEELYERAKELDILGRSKMSKDELAEAIRRSS